MNNIEYNKIQYRDFLTGEEVIPPQILGKKVLDEAKEYLQPSPFRIFKKVFLIHLFASVLSLAVCPQFGVGWVGGSHGLLAPIMHYGPVVCAASCGAVFFGISAILAVFLLRVEELRMIYKKGFWQYSVIALISWLVLMLWGEMASLEFTSIWIVSGIISATVIQALGTTFKSYRQYA